MCRLIEIHGTEELNREELQVFTSYNEAQLLHYYEPNGGLFIAETPMIAERALQAGCEPITWLVEKQYLESVRELISKHSEATVYVADHEVLTGLTGYQLTRGVLCAMKRPSPIPLEKIMDSLAQQEKGNLVVLEDVMNPTNLGAIFRCAAALNADAILLTKGCSNPLYRRAARVSMGTVFQIPWTYLEEDLDWTTYLHNCGYKLFSMALRENCHNLGDESLLGISKKAVIMGTEATGISEKVLEDSDYIVKIPMSHGVDSLNVAAASAVTFWELF